MISLTENETKEIIEFLHGLVHGPCASVHLSDYEKYARNEADDILRKIAHRKLMSAGAYGRTIDRWWDGFYTERAKPTVYETATKPVEEIQLLIRVGSRRG